MRHATLLVSALIAGTTSAQDYLANEPVWMVRSMCSAPAPCIANDTYNYYTAGDSLIEGTTWTKVLRQGSYTLSWQGPGPVDPDCQGLYTYGTASYSVKLIRQEGRQLRIWADDSDQLLYEFDLVVGSTLPIAWNNWTPDITVVAVDSVLIGTEMRARYELENSWAQYMVEGVGTSNGLFEPVSNFLDCGYFLDCFGLGAEAYYPEGVGSSCWLPMAVDAHRVAPTPALAPNPADATVSITTDGTEQVVVLRDMRGSIVRQEWINAAPKATLDVSALPNGYYALTIGGAVPMRLVVAH